jgi:phosphotransferase system  glucose/maltose/N-acetylglucosamine-specific IIC component
MKASGKRELFVAIGFTLVSAFAHLVWNPIVDYWQFVATTLLFVTALTLWLIKEWRGLISFVTRFYCIAVIFDVFAEGLLQPYHRCTFNNIMCTGRLFLVFFAFWLVLRPVERWLDTRKVPSR